MTVQTTDRLVIYQGNGSATTFPFNFRIPSGALSVSIQDYVTKDILEVLAPGDYLVTGLDNDAGGEIIYSPNTGPLVDAYSIVILRTVPYTQELDISPYGGFSPTTVEQQLDLIVMQIQQLAEAQSRSLIVNPGEEPPDAQTIVNAELYAEQAEAAAATIVGLIGNLTGEIESAAFATANYHPSTGPNFLRVAGRTSPGDGGGGLFIKSVLEPFHAAKFSITLLLGGTTWYEYFPLDSIDPIVVGAKADGITDDAAALILAATAAQYFGVPLFLREGRVYVFNSAIALGKTPGMKGRGTLKYTGTAGEVFTFGGSLGTGKTLATQANMNASGLNVAAHGFAAEQMLWIRSGENCLADSTIGNRRLGPTNGTDNVKYCEFAQVQSVTDANNFVLNGTVYYAYPITTTIVYPVDLHRQLVLEEFTFDGGDMGIMTIEYCLHPEVKRSCRFINPGDAALVIEHTLGGQINPTVLRAAASDNVADPSRYQGIKVRDGCQDINLAPYVINGEQGVDVTYTPSSPTNGTCRNIKAANGVYIGINQQACTSHEGIEGFIIENNLIEDGGDGVSVRGPLSVIRGNKIRGRSTDAGNEGIRIGNAYANSTIVEDNEIYLFATGIITLGNTAALRRDEIIRGNRIRKCSIGINITTKLAATLSDYGLRVTDNEIVDSVVSGIVLEDNLNGSVVNGNVVRQENNVALTGFAIRIGNGANYTALGNKAVEPGSAIRALDLATGTTGKFKDNTLIGAGLLSDTNPGAEFEYTITLADDTAVSLGIQATTLHVRMSSTAAQGNGQASLANGVVNYVQGNANFAAATGVLNGTSGVDGNITVSKTGGNFYIENRSGASRTLVVKLSCDV